MSGSKTEMISNIRFFGSMEHVKARFHVLDGMRGVGALSVVLFHAGTLASDACAKESCFVPFGYLAVDLFFVLSGFVISHSYGPRLQQGMTFGRFMRARVVRLYPIFFVCALVGSLPLIWLAFHGQGSRGRLAITMATNLLLLPAPTYPVQPDPFPLVSPAWSLFFELWVANVSYGLIAKRLTNRLLACIVGVSFAALIATMVVMGTINGGWLWQDFLAGFPRVMFSFYLGVAVHRLSVRYEPPAISPWILLAIAAAAFWPRVQGVYSIPYELVCVALMFPALIYLGAYSNKRKLRIATLLGDLSYPLYLIHIPILLIALQLLPHYGGLNKGTPLLVEFVTFVIALAWALNSIYDPPARKFLDRFVTGVEHRFGPEFEEEANG